jgi:hypothetical protein
MTKQRLTHHVAICFECKKQCDAKNAQAWAHNHARTTGHNVELQLAYFVKKEG